MNYVTDQLKNLNSYNDLLEAIDNKVKSIYMHGLVKESIGHFIYSLFEHKRKNIVVILEDELSVKNLYENISSFGKDIVEIYPSSDINYYNISSLENKDEDTRLKVINRLMNKEKFITVTTPLALQRKISSVKNFNKLSLKINIEDLINLEEITERLSYLQYERVNTIESKGQFAIRGGILDIYPIQMDNPVRIELFDDEIDSMRLFDISSQRSIENIDNFIIPPSKELILNDKQRKKIIDGLCKDLDKIEHRTMYGIDKEKLSEKFVGILEHMEQELHISNMDLITPYLRDTDYGNLFDYIPEDSLIYVEDLARVYDRSSEMQNLKLEELTYKMEKGEAFESHENILLPFSDILIDIKKFIAINSTALVKKTRLLNPEIDIKIESMEAPNFNRNITALIETIEQNLYNGYKIVIFADSEEKGNSLKLLFEAEGITPIIRDNFEGEIKTGQVVIVSKSLLRGFEYHKLKYLFLTHKEIYGKERIKSKKRKARKKTSQDIINYSDLVVDDFVVHENHGVGQYKGIEQIEVQGIKKDYIVIQYRGQDKLFIPTDQMNLVQKYIGGEVAKPKINKLSGTEWQKTKYRAKKAIEEIAEDLVELYAKRLEVKGYKFSKDTEWQKEFEDSFIYEETPSQLRSIDEIKQDMESEKPMDRLLCGDVGYGKTEVAIRAAFKAIMDGKQVAFLVPTTILAQQHYNTIVERFKEYPIKVEMLSRFRTAKEQNKILKDTSKGLIDIVVGTHKILSNKLEFKDLGLLIVDEEQRFGVKHKETLKKLSENIDVLTLSATPIPRTLQMGLVGIRDMSLLEDPPEERFPINTYVIEYNEQIIRDAIEKEISRGGQIYFVYNRIEDIDDRREELLNLVPDAKIAIAHGRMTEKELESVMLDFTDGEYDILLCTTIIETGLDIANVNTMIVYGADRMGLSQLYQLKGRIGRGDRTSFAYFTYQENKSLSEISEKRLMAIKDFTEFGSGFKIAMRDLELRGAGNILGESQSGYISSIGYDLYVKLLEETLGEIKGETKIVRESEIEIDIKLDGYIPSSYIDDSNEKIDMYKKIATISSEEDYDEIVEELIDRFGDVPKMVQNIMDISLMKSYAAKVGFSRIYEKASFINLVYSEKKEVNFKELEYMSENYKGKMSFDLSDIPVISVEIKEKNIKPIIDLLKVINTFNK
ncbi:transcription-repair coupling factor [Miniphocaeibacter massiliensis]|uniref:transcription-repair coupling factor n=1 Tax=Miniphocaeibacter massiliensis TaxID=2041841 RepID=UPI000C1BD229|nr:transcription-repair coupling factor [Miniphocaeibacter massiliensis]